MPAVIRSVCGRGESLPSLAASGHHRHSTQHPPGTATRDHEILRSGPPDVVGPQHRVSPAPHGPDAGAVASATWRRPHSRPRRQSPRHQVGSCGADERPARREILEIEQRRSTIFASARLPRDEARTETSGEISEIPARMVQTLTAFFESGHAPNPHDVAEAIARP